MAIQIRGFTLPALLERFLDEGIWTNERVIEIPQKTLAALDILDQVTVRTYNLEYLRAENSDWAWQTHIDDESFAVYEYISAWASSKRIGAPITDETKLDIDYAVVIASEWNDDVICLDYRLDADNPRVLVIDYAHRRWCTLAPDFETFARDVGLIE